MHAILHCLNAIIIVLSIQNAYATDEVQRSVWVNEAIVSMYTFDYQNMVNAQSEMAKYFTAEAWMTYNKAFNDAKLAETIQKNTYTVSAVASSPPVVFELQPNYWQAIMPVLVAYKQGSTLKQQQQLEVNIQFKTADSGQGVRGLSIISWKSKETEPPCDCKNTAASELQSKT